MTLIELLVVIAVIALLVAIGLVGIQSGREAARRTACAANLHQLAVALENYHSVHRMFPPGSSKGYSFHAAILPQLQLGTLAEQIDYSIEPWDAKNQPIRHTFVDIFACPSDGAASIIVGPGYGSNYAGNFGSGVQAFGYNGMFAPTGFGPIVRDAMVIDGLSQTAALSEILVAIGDRDRLRTNWYTLVDLSGAGQLDQFADTCEELDTDALWNTAQEDWNRGRGWLRGDSSVTLYNHVLPPNRLSCFNKNSVRFGAFTAASNHPGGVHVLFGDGHAQFVNSDVVRSVWRAMGSRDGIKYGEVVQ